jgi:hypothetical protein
MDWAAHLTVPRRRLRVAVTAVVMLATLTVGTTGVAASTPTPVSATAAAAGTGPRTPAPGFLLKRGRYTRFDAPDAVQQTVPSASTPAG